MTKKRTSTTKRGRREYTDEFKEEAVQILLNGHKAPDPNPAHTKRGELQVADFGG